MPAAKSVVILKMMNGQEIIARCVLANDNIFKLEKVREIGLTPDWKIQLAPYIISYPDATIEVNVDNISCQVVTIPEDLEKEYLNTTSTIKIADSIGSIK